MEKRAVSMQSNPIRKNGASTQSRTSTQKKQCSKRESYYNQKQNGFRYQERMNREEMIERGLYY